MESNRVAIGSLALGIVGLFTAGLLGVGSLVGLALATSVLTRPPSRDRDVAWAALVANVFALLTVLPLAGALLGYQAVSGVVPPLDSRSTPSPLEPLLEPEGTLTVPPPPPPPPLSVGRGPDSASEPAHVSDVIDRPKKVHHVNPIYPEAARRGGVQGEVVLECTISPAGEVVDVKLLRGNPELDQAAIAAVEQWRYTPTLLNGVPVPVIMTVTVSFKLGQGPGPVGPQPG